MARVLHRASRAHVLGVATDELDDLGTIGRINTNRASVPVPELKVA